MTPLTFSKPSARSIGQTYRSDDVPMSYCAGHFKPCKKGIHTPGALCIRYVTSEVACDKMKDLMRVPSMVKQRYDVSQASFGVIADLCLREPLVSHSRSQVPRSVDPRQLERSPCG